MILPGDLPWTDSIRADSPHSADMIWGIPYTHLDNDVHIPNSTSWKRDSLDASPIWGPATDILVGLRIQILLLSPQNGLVDW